MKYFHCIAIDFFLVEDPFNNTCCDTHYNNYNMGNIKMVGDIISSDHVNRVRMMDVAAAEEEERKEGRVKTNVFAYVMSCLVIFTFTFIKGQEQ